MFLLELGSVYVLVGIVSHVGRNAFFVIGNLCDAVIYRLPACFPTDQKGLALTDHCIHVFFRLIPTFENNQKIGASELLQVIDYRTQCTGIVFVSSEGSIVDRFMGIKGINNDLQCVLELFIVLIPAPADICKTFP